MVNVQVEIPANIPRSNQTLRDNALRIALIYVGWLTLFVVAGWISKRLIPKFRALERKDQILWQLSMARILSGPPIIWIVYIIYIDDRVASDHVFASTDESWTLFCILIGFFMFEELTLIYFDTKYHAFSKELHIHHFFTLSGLFNVTYYNLGHYYTAKLFILQISTPFSCICWCLLKLKLEKTRAWKINQWILIYIFNLRSVYELYCWYGIYHEWDLIKQNLSWGYIINMTVGLAALTVWLTPYWTYRKTLQYFYPSYKIPEATVKKEDELNKIS